jgi:hypothetical protein
LDAHIATARRGAWRPWLLPTVAAACALLVVALAWLAAALKSYPVADLVRDPSTVSESRWWTGGAAMLNATLWGVAAALGGFVASLHRTHRAGLLLYTALSFVLLIEDTFQTKVLVRPLGEMPILAGYAVLGLVCAWLLRPAHTGPAGWTLLAAGMLFAVSLLFDQARGESYESLILLEFGPMLVGSAVWACVPVLLHQHLVRADAQAGNG